MRIPLFPLNTVLFPGMVIPLHIFEERYKLMVRRCLSEQAPFGVVLIRQGDEVGGAALPYEVGTLAQITQVEHLPDGRMNINATGISRFRIRELLAEEPYPAAEVETYPLATASPGDVAPLMKYLRPRIAGYIALLNQDPTTSVETVDMPEDPVELAYLIAIALQIPLDDKQNLLTIRSAQDLLQQERQMLNRERVLLEFMVNTAEAQNDLVLGPTGHLFLN